MRITTALVALTGSACTTPSHGQVISSDLAGGSGMIVITQSSAMLPPSGFLWGGESPAIGPAEADFYFGNDEVDPSSGAQLGTYATIDCYPLDWTALSAGGPTPIASLGCQLDVSVLGGDSTATDYADVVTAGAITATSSLDSNGNGTVTLQFDVATPVAATEAGTQSIIDLTVALDGLRGTAMFGDVSSSTDHCELCSI